MSVDRKTATPRGATFVLTLRALPRSDDDSGMRRLRGCLKWLLRVWGLRCVWIEYPAAVGTPDDEYAIPFGPPEGMEGRECDADPQADASPAPVKGRPASTPAMVLSPAGDLPQDHTPRRR